MVNTKGLILLIAFSALPFACARSPRGDLENSGIPYTVEEFLKRAKCGDAGAVSLFLAAGMHPDVRNEHGATALILAAEEGNTDVLEILIAHDADPNMKPEGVTALDLVAITGNTDGMRVLLAGGADANVPSYMGVTPLMSASEFCGPEMVRLLLEHGADVNAKTDFGKTALHEAAQVGCTEIVEILLESGADVNARVEGPSGLTPLTYAALGGYIETVKVLLDAGADPNPKGSKGWTLLRGVLKAGHPEVATLLREAGAKEELPKK